MPKPAALAPPPSLGTLDLRPGAADTHFLFTNDRSLVRRLLADRTCLAVVNHYRHHRRTLGYDLLVAPDRLAVVEALVLRPD